MADVFISYSRKDIAFARLVHQALIENDLETWIDWQDIPPSVDWLAEVYEAIEQADAFLFIISETSLDSEICGLEIAHAAKHNKRLIPIVIKDVNANKVPKELAVVNWIFFEDAGEKFDRAMDDLVTAITVDQGWVKAHTRFENRALDWERKERDRGLLLRGSDLNEAEAWLGGSAGKDPQPTALQTEFILKSREDATRRQRTTLMGVGAALVVAIGLGILAWTQRNVAVSEGQARATAQAEAVTEAEMRATAQSVAEQEADARATQQAIAEEQRDLAISRELTTQSGLVNESGNWELAVLLAVEAFNNSPTEEVYRNLNHLLSQAGQVAFRVQSFDESWGIDAIDWTPSGEQLFIMHPGRDAYLLDPRSGDELMVIDNIGRGNTVWAPDGHRVVRYYFADEQFEIWDIANGTKNITVETEQPISQPQWSRDGRKLLASLRLAVPSVGSAAIWDTWTGLEIVAFRGHEERVNGARWDPSEERVLTTSRDTTAKIWDAGTGDELVTLDGHTGSVRGGSWSADGTRVLTWAEDNSARVWEAESGRELFVIQADSIVRASWNQDETRILTRASDYRPVVAQLWDAESGELLFTFEHPSYEYSSGSPQALWSPDEHYLLTHASDGGNILWNAASGEQLFPLNADWESDGNLSWSPNGEMILEAGCFWRSGLDCLQGGAIIWDVSTGKEMVRLGVQGKFDLMHWSEDSRSVLTLGPDDVIRMWNVDPVPVLPPLVGHTDTITDVSYDPESQQLLTASYDETFRLWDLDTGKQIRAVETGTSDGINENLNSAIWSPDHTQILSLDWYGWLKLWDARSGNYITTIAPEKGIGIYETIPEMHGLPKYLNYNAEWSAGQEQILTAGCYREWDRSLPYSVDHHYVCDQGYIQIWDLDQKDVLREFRSGNKITSVSWDPGEDRVLAELCELDEEDKCVYSAIVWDPEIDQVISRFTDHPERIVALNWSSDGERVLSAGSEGTVYIWEAATGRILKTFVAEEDNLLNAVWNRDETKIVTTSTKGTTRIWDAHSGSERLTLTGHTGTVSAIWSDDETQLMTKGGDGVVNIWDAESGELKRSIQAHSSTIMSATWINDGSRILTADIEGEIRQWYLHVEDLVAVACKRVGRNLTEEEWNRYFADRPYHQTCSSFMMERSGSPPLFENAKLLARRGNIPAAIKAFVDRDNSDTGQKVRAWDWNYLCWFGSIWEQADQVMFACDKAVELSPEDGTIRDSRGLARALTGDYEGAMQDFQFFIDWVEEHQSNAYRDESEIRKDWMDILSEGKNPVDEEFLLEQR